MLWRPAKVVSILWPTAASAALYWLALPPRSMPVIGLFSLTPTLLATRNASWTRAATQAWIAYAATVLVCCSWLAGTLVDFAGMSGGAASLGLVAFAAFEGGRCALAMALLRASRAPRAYEPALLAAALVVVDFVYPQALQWPLGIALLPNLALLQPVAWVGPSALSAIVGLASGCLMLALCDARTHRNWLIGYGLALCLIYWLGAGRLMRPAPPAPTLKLGLVQGGAEPGLKRKEPNQVLRRYEMSTRELLRKAPATELVVWSETAAAKPLDVTHWRELLHRRLQGGFEAPLLLGASLSSYDGAGPSKLFNSAVLLSRDAAACDPCRYDKQQLVPFAETLPGGEALRSVFPRAGRYSRAEHSAPLQLGDARLAAFICYESLNAELVRGLVGGREPAELLIGITNDGWFGRSAGGALHFALGNLRAIEQDRYLVRVAETGISAVVDPRGRVLQQLAPHRPGMLTAEVPRLRGSTLFARTGSWPLAALAAALLGVTLLRRLRGASTT